MMAPASGRPRPPAQFPTIGVVTRKRRSTGTYVLLAIPLLLAGAFLWQIGSGLFHTQVVARQPVAVGQVALEPDPTGTRVDVVLVDRVGQDTTLDGSLNVSVREPDGAVWQTSRSVTNADFETLPSDSIMAGRTGYTLVVSAGDWAHLPRRGGLATVSVRATPGDGSAVFSTQTQQLFP